MTAITGETGAGKTLLLTALQLLVGGRADPGDGRPTRRRGRGRGPVRASRRRGRDPAGRARVGTLAGLPERTARQRRRRWPSSARQLVEVNGQHSHTALVATAAQRAALDRYCGVDLAPLVEARMARRDLGEQLAALGGDERERLREQELYRYPGRRDRRGRHRRRRRGRSSARRGGAARGRRRSPPRRHAPQPSCSAPTVRHRRRWRRCSRRVDADGPLAELAARVHGLAAELTDVAADARGRRRAHRGRPRTARRPCRNVVELLSDLRRKYGDSLARGPRLS